VTTFLALIGASFLIEGLSEMNLSTRPQIVALTKIDGVDKKRLKSQLQILKKTVPKSTPLTAISSLNREGIKELLRLVQKKTAQAKISAKKKVKKELPVIGLREEDSWRVAWDYQSPRFMSI